MEWEPVHNDGEYYSLASVDHNGADHKVDSVVGTLVAGSHDELEQVQEQALETEQDDHLQR